jgi:hypothetical protein
MIGTGARQEPAVTLRPVNSPFRTITDPRDMTTSLAPWTTRPS